MAEVPNNTKQAMRTPQMNVKMMLHSSRSHFVSPPSEDHAKLHAIDSSARASISNTRVSMSALSHLLALCKHFRTSLWSGRELERCDAPKTMIADCELIMCMCAYFWDYVEGTPAGMTGRGSTHRGDYREWPLRTIVRCTIECLSGQLSGHSL